MTTKPKEICERFDAEFVPPAPSEKVGIALASLDKLPLNAMRNPGGDGMSGWFIYGGEFSTDADFFQPLCVAHLRNRCPDIVPYLALPSGWRVLLAPNYEDVWFDRDLLEGVTKAR
ncbi:MAG TPA: hypothetical protein VGD30_18025 [Telluria sp.]